jgi:hypothetical protein
MTGLNYQIAIKPSTNSRQQIDTSDIRQASGHADREWIAHLRSSILGTRDELLRIHTEHGGLVDYDDQEFIDASLGLDLLLSKFVLDHGGVGFADTFSEFSSPDGLSIVLAWSAGPPAVAVCAALESKLRQALRGIQVSTSCSLQRWHDRAEIGHLVAAIAQSWRVAAPAICDRVVQVRVYPYRVFTLPDAWESAIVQGRPLGVQMSEALDSSLADGVKLNCISGTLTVPLPTRDELQALLLCDDASLRLAAMQLMSRRDIE